ncbi:MAG: U32 family peptidase [Bacteroidales bacterium]|nr:U32 family peptidase [Bacteroidales bacterium]
MTKLELLAPARNTDIGIAAIDCGADAVYIAGPQFGARQSAGNSMEDVRRLCEYAHKFGVKIFLTLNTILFDSELKEAECILAEAARAGVDAVIAQDLAVFEILRCAQNDGALNGIEVHASTQCAIRTPEQARFYESLGATRLVLERQLSVEQIRAIREAVNCELEFFVHGALCVCYSGQCYMSESIEGRSANRGACIQACRSIYDLVDGKGKTLVKDKALLSLKDYNLLGRLEDLAEAGICSFKIEGRLKNISYVRNVVRAYSNALDELVAKYPDVYCRSSFGRVEGGFKPDLAKTFNRGYTQLFLDRKRGKWSSMDTPKSAGETIGTVVNIKFASTKKMEITIKLNNPATILRNGDGFSFISKDHNEIRGFRGDVCSVSTIVCQGVPGLYVGAEIRRNFDTAFEKELESNLPKRLIPVTVQLKIQHGHPTNRLDHQDQRQSATAQPSTLLSSASDSEFMVTTKAESQDGRIVEFDLNAGSQPASNLERMKAMFKSQMEKETGIYTFSLSSIEMHDEELPFLPASAINGIRREIAQRLDGSEHTGLDGSAAGHHVILRPKAEESIVHVSETIDYKYNIANTSARETLLRLGAKKIENAFELTHRKDAELMRSKYCIRYELGICQGPATMRSDNSGLRPAAGDLFLINNGKRYRLHFDCANCEMTLSSL